MAPCLICIKWVVYYEARLLGLPAWLACIAPVGTGDISRSVAHLDKLCPEEPEAPRQLGLFAVARTIAGIIPRRVQAIR